MIKYLRLIIFAGVSSLALLCMSGCVKYNDLLPQEVPQGVKKKRPLHILSSYMKSLYLYDEFSTKALFDILWMADDVQKVYATTVAERKGESESVKQQHIKELLEINKEQQKYYVLADIRGRDTIYLQEKQAAWSMYLTFTDGRKLQPLSIQEVDLPRDIQYFFGPRYTHFKTAYEVIFPAVDEQGIGYSYQLGSFSMIIAAPDCEGRVVWSHQESTECKACDEEDYYWS